MLRLATSVALLFSSPFAYAQDRPADDPVEVGCEGTGEWSYTVEKVGAPFEDCYWVDGWVDCGEYEVYKITYVCEVIQTYQQFKVTEREKTDPLTGQTTPCDPLVEFNGDPYEVILGGFNEEFGDVCATEPIECTPYRNEFRYTDIEYVSETAYESTEEVDCPDQDEPGTLTIKGVDWYIIRECENIIYYEEAGCPPGIFYSYDSIFDGFEHTEVIDCGPAIPPEEPEPVSAVLAPRRERSADRVSTPRLMQEGLPVLGLMPLTPQYSIRFAG